MASYKVTDTQLTAIAEQIRLLQRDIVTEGYLTVEEDGQIVYVNARYAVINRNHEAILFRAGLLPAAGTTYTYTFRYFTNGSTGFSEPFTRTYTAESSVSTSVYFWFPVEEMPEDAFCLVIDQVAQNAVPKAFSVDRYAFPDGFIHGLQSIETITNNTGDASATPETILSGKTAYVKGQKITGTGTTFFLEESGSYTKSNAIWMINGTNYTAGNAFGDPVQMPADRLVAKKAALTDYTFTAGNATISGHLQVQAVTTKTVGGVEYVDTIQLGHKENWKATGNGRLSVTFSNLDWIKAAFGVPA